MFLFESSPVSTIQSIEQKLSANEDIPLEEFLLDSSVLVSFRQNARVTDNYVKKHEREILHEALKPDVSKTVLAAFLLLMSQNKDEIIREILEMDFFVDVCITHFQSGSTTSMIGRMASLAGNFLVSGFKKASVNFHKIIFHFLDYTNNYSVMSMFIHLFNKNVSSNIHEWLLKKGLVYEIAKRINTMDIDYKAESCDDYYAKFADLYKLITIGCQNPILSEGFSCEEIFVSLTHSFRHAPAYVDGAKWGAVNALVSNEQTKLIDMFVPMSISLLTGATEKASPDVTNCILFVTKIISISQTYRTLLETAQVPQIILRIMIQFQSSSILANTFIDFTMEAIKYDEFEDRIVNSYIPFFMSIVYSRERTPLTPLAKKLLIDVIEYAEKKKKLMEKLKNLDCFEEVLRVLVKYKRKLDDHYGGEIFVNIAMTME